MMELLLTAYILIWPIAVFAVLGVMCVAVYRDYRKAATDGEEVV